MIELGLEGYVRRRSLNRVGDRPVHFNLSGVKRNYTKPRIFFQIDFKKLAHQKRKGKKV